MLVRRIARPISGGGEDLHHQQAFGRELRLDDVVDLPCGVPGSPDLDLDVLRSHEGGLATRVTAGAADRQLERPVRLHSVGGVARKVDRPGHAVENALAAADLPALPVRLDPAPPFQRHENDLDFTGLRRERSLPHAEMEIPPARRLRRHLLPGPRTQHVLAHTNAPSSSSSLGIASEQESCVATSAPATVPRRTTSTSGRPRNTP